MCFSGIGFALGRFCLMPLSVVEFMLVGPLRVIYDDECDQFPPCAAFWPYSCVLVVAMAGMSALAYRWVWRWPDLALFRRLKLLAHFLWPPVTHAVFAGGFVTRWVVLTLCCFLASWICSDNGHW